MIQVLRLLRAAAGSDRDLLDRYVLNRDEEAFEALVRRYGAGVWAAAVRLAGRDAEDAFQAVFLTLSRKAGTVTGSLPAWLHAVTRRVASTLRRSARRRNAIEATAARPDLANGTDPSLREGLALLDEELSRLPMRYRAVLIVCCLEGRSRDEAAVQLGWSEGQVKGRLERAREMLRARLAQRGFELGGLLLGAAVAGPIPARANPPSAAALTLTNGVIRTMLIQKLRLAVVVLAVCVGVALAGGVVLRAQPGDPSQAEPIGVANAPKEPPEKTASASKGGSSPKGQIDEKARKEIEDLRKRVEALERMQKLPPAVFQKIVVTSPLAKDVSIAQQYVARIRAHRHINVSALASGAISEVAVKEGQAVKKGDALFKVLPILSQAKLDAEMAELQIAQLEFNNTKKLFENKTVSQQELSIYEAKLAKAKAKVRLAETELAFTTVRAPFDGLVGRFLQQQGSVVKEGDALTTLSDTSLMWVYFNVPEGRYLEYMADRDQVKIGTPVELVLANGAKFPEAGKLAAIAAGFENDSGNIPFRADFPNPKGLLRHGQTGTVLIRESLKNAIIIPQRATFEVLDQRYVFVVGKDNVIHRREIVVRNEQENLFVVKKGLEVSDRIILEGVRQVHDGDKVEYEFRKPEEVIGNSKAHPE
jgi:membrane fusion protein (multidrug efflux system)